MLQLNLLDLGNYRQCLGINTKLDDMVIDGKYCLIRTRSLELVGLGGTITELENVNKVVDAHKDKINVYERIRKHILALDGVESEKTIR